MEKQNDQDKFGFDESEYENAGGKFKDGDFSDLDNNVIKAEIIKFGESLSGFTKIVFNKILKMLGMK